MSEIKVYYSDRVEHYIDGQLVSDETMRYGHDLVNCIDTLAVKFPIMSLDEIIDQALEQLRKTSD